jgi:hypothetical protein
MLHDALFVTTLVDIGPLAITVMTSKVVIGPLKVCVRLRLSTKLYRF